MAIRNSSQTSPSFLKEKETPVYTSAAPLFQYTSNQNFSKVVFLHSSKQEYLNIELRRKDAESQLTLSVYKRTVLSSPCGSNIYVVLVTPPAPFIPTAVSHRRIHLKCWQMA